MKMSVLLRQHFWKTKMCPLYLENRCKEGDNCDYAHSIEDLRTIPDLRRTKLCHKLLKGDKCFNKKCNYAHTQEELKSAQNLFAYKSSMCKFIGTNNCLNGSTCRFAHFVEELRVPRAPEILLEQNNSQVDVQHGNDINNATHTNTNNANTNHIMIPTNNNNISNNNNNNNNSHKKEDDIHRVESHTHYNMQMQHSEMDAMRNCDSRNMRNTKLVTQNNFVDKNNGNGNSRGGRKERKDMKYRNKQKENKTNKSKTNPPFMYQMDPAYQQRASTDIYAADYEFYANKRMSSNTTNYDNVNYNPMDGGKYLQDQTDITYEDVQMPQGYEPKESTKRNNSLKIEKESNGTNKMMGNQIKCEDSVSEKTVKSGDNMDRPNVEEEEKREYEPDVDAHQLNHITNKTVESTRNLMNQRSQLNCMNNLNSFRKDMTTPQYPIYQQYPMPMQYAYPYMVPYYNYNNQNSYMNNDMNNAVMNVGCTNDTSPSVHNSVNPLQYVAATQMPNAMYYYYYPYQNNVQANPVNVNYPSHTTAPTPFPMAVREIHVETNETHSNREDSNEENGNRKNHEQSVEYETKDIKENMTDESCENSSLGIVEENVTCAFEVYRDQIVYSKLDEKLIEKIDKTSKQKEKNPNEQLKNILSESLQLKLNYIESEHENDIKEEDKTSNVIASNKKDSIQEDKESKQASRSTHSTDDHTNNNSNNNLEVNMESSTLTTKKKAALPCSVYSYISNADMNNGKSYTNETPCILPIPVASTSTIPNNMNPHHMNYMNIPMNNYNMYNPNYASTSPYYWGTPYNMYNNDQVYKY